MHIIQNQDVKIVQRLQEAEVIQLGENKQAVAQSAHFHLSLGFCGLAGENIEAQQFPLIVTKAGDAFRHHAVRGEARTKTNKRCLLTPQLALGKVALCLVRRKTSSASPAQRRVHAGARKSGHGIRCRCQVSTSFKGRSTRIYF